MDTKMNRLTRLAETQRREQKKAAELIQQLMEMMAEVTRRLPKDVSEEQDGPTSERDTVHAEGSEVDGTEDQSDTASWDDKWSDTDDDDDDDDEDAGSDGDAYA